MSFLAIVGVVVGWIALRTWLRHHNSRLTLNADGLHHTGWTRPIRFDELEGIAPLEAYGKLSAVLQFKASQSPIWKPSIWRLKSKDLHLPLNGMSADQAAIYEAILRYYARHIE